VSQVWQYGDCYRNLRDHRSRYRCRLCVGGRTFKLGAGNSTSNAVAHLRVHNISVIGRERETPSEIDRETNSPISTSYHSFVNIVKIEVLKDRLLQWIISDNVPFSVVESDRFLKILNYLNPGIEDKIGGRRTLSRMLVLEFQRCQTLMKSLLAISLSKIHLSFDLWTSPNQLAIVGIVAHWIGQVGQVGQVGNPRCQCALIAMKSLDSSHSGDNIANVIIPVIQEYEIQDRLGVFVADNADSNDRAIAAILQHFGQLPANGDISSRRSRCLGHIVNLAAKAFLFGKDTQAFEEVGEDSSMADIKRAQETWRKRGPVGKLHNIVVYIRASPQRRAHFKRVLVEESDEQQDDGKFTTATVQEQSTSKFSCGAFLRSLPVDLWVITRSILVS
jgi:hypothetical protein